ncbi:SMC-Scp complex subunit ScpB [Pacificimonas sp. WHA3]|uniref:SMC-Scp complex subunit ScpB n=1 Tax=Pacificimonas pallii TaxID=2827236 RepID=A0ABS6SEV3_9SPHN|nr:SMC-Scp complex subunit ScpB [Pacificimonas pallii]MBV7256866.1 SMC-Scp complex subunit ScpB [Pacificimonas pallii]
MNETLRIVEAVLFAAEEPLSLDVIGAHLPENAPVKALLVELAESYHPRGINLVERGGKWLFQTAPDLSHILRRETARPRKLSRAAIETLSVIAYHEPVTRAQVEEIRGVSLSKGTLDVLMELGWVRPAGRREVPGRPLLYATTTGFLVHFGLTSRRDLPGIQELKAAGLLDPMAEALELAREEAEQPDMLEDADDQE